MNGVEEYVGIRDDSKAYTKASRFEKWVGPLNNSCCIESLTTGPADGETLYLGVGKDNELFSKTGPLQEWTGPHAHSCCVKDVVLNGSIIYGNKSLFCLLTLKFTLKSKKS